MVAPSSEDVRFSHSFFLILILNFYLNRQLGQESHQKTSSRYWKIETLEAYCQKIEDDMYGDELDGGEDRNDGMNALVIHSFTL